MEKHAALIAGTHSGVGKTTWTLALGSMARRRGLQVQPFKAGPDYIDPGFHHQISSGRRSRNLDLFLLSEETLQKTFAKNSAAADLVLVEGVMGLFDGKDFKGQASSAELAKLLKLPVFLVVDGSAMAASAAAVVYGFQKLDPELHLAGVFFNRVNSEAHYQYLKQAVELRVGIPCLGFLPKDLEISIPERSLGLTDISDFVSLEGHLEKMIQLLEPRLDWQGFLQASSRNFIENPGLDAVNLELKDDGGQRGKKIKIAVARDKAFSFYYEDNLDLLQEAGAEIAFFSPLQDAELPEADLLYLGGGFPELHAPLLSSNQSMLAAIRNFYRDGGWIYAECGGLMYLCETFCSSDHKEFLFAGLIPGKVRMTPKLQHFGYHELKAAKNNFLFPEGTEIRSHEFHYSIWDQEGLHAPAYFIGDRQEGFAAPRLLATYQHLHFASVPDFPASLRRTLSKERNSVC